MRYNNTKSPAPARSQQSCSPRSLAFRQIIADGGSDDSDDAAALKATIATLAADLQYVRFFPKAEHYVPLFPSGKQAEDETLPTR